MRQYSNSTTTSHYVTAACPAGKILISGGGSVHGGSADDPLRLKGSYPNQTEWVAITNRVPRGNEEIRAYVVCVDNPNP
ncbi:hypothetical protein [Bacillus pseudomycoides]|uniref:hypothetical protein n=1 Tax=Bacillus pseudomycoides TaxID=64104 RepID=UPI001155DDCE|nr:hypothetical protein [Bacillus pseudomycoides]